MVRLCQTCKHVKALISVAIAFLLGKAAPAGKKVSLRFPGQIIGSRSGWPPNAPRAPCFNPLFVGAARGTQSAGVPCFVKAFPVGGHISHRPEEWPDWARVQEVPS